MKLKKIASLMLAGIMAVSMLAACGEGKKDDSSSSSSETPVTSNILSMIESKVKVLNSDLTVSYKNSDPMNAALDELAAEKGNTYGVIMNGDGRVAVKPVLQNVFAPNFTASAGNLANDDVDGRSQGTRWYYLVTGNSTLPDADVRTLAAYSVADKLADVENTFTVDHDKTNRTADVTVYSHEMSVTKTDGTSTPVIVSVVKVSVSIKSY